MVGDNSSEQLHEDNVILHSRMDKMLYTLIGMVVTILLATTAGVWAFSAAFQTHTADELNSRAILLAEVKSYADKKIEQTNASLYDVVALLADMRASQARMGAQVKGHDDTLREVKGGVNGVILDSKERMQIHISREHR